MTNEEALNIYQNKSSLRELKGFKLAKTIIINMNKINDELISVIKEIAKNMEESGDSAEDIKKAIEDILTKDCEIAFVKVTESDIPEYISVEQLSLIDNFIEK